MSVAPARLVFDGPLLVFGGPYGNLEASEALLAEAVRRGIAPDNMICTGDLVAYCADPQAVIDLWRSAGVHIVRGNCEESLAAGADACDCGFEDGTLCAALAEAWYAFADAEVDRDSRSWMAGLPARLDLAVGGFDFAVVHGAVSRVNRFVFASDERAIHDELALTAGAGVIGGHCGLPFTRSVGGRLWHNSGVIGMPANDGTPRVWFSVLTPHDGGLRIEHCALDYDHRGSAAKMRARGLPEGYAAALETGLWPSLDVLPAEEARRTGRALEQGEIVWRPAADGAGIAWPAFDTTDAGAVARA